jgi:hypothetical protein
MSDNKIGANVQMMLNSTELIRANKIDHQFPGDSCMQCAYL